MPPIDSDHQLSRYFMPHQVQWITAEDAIHAQHKQAIALAEKSVRIGWTYADAFKNVRKRILHKDRDYLFATKDYTSALEYVRQCYKFAEIFNLTHSIVRHGEESITVNKLDANGKVSAFTEDIRIGVIKFDNGSRIIAFSANPQAMAVYGGDVGLDEFAKHPNAKLLWETAQGRIAWGGDLAVWSSHDGEDTLFNEFARQARAALSKSSSSTSSFPLSNPENPPARSCRGDEAADSLSDSTVQPFNDSTPSSGSIEIQKSKIKNLHPVRCEAISPGPSTINSPWNLYFRVTMADAIENGLVERINRAKGTNFTREQYLADCRARSGSEEVFEQAYMCNPAGASTNHIVEWSAIERCRHDYDFIRVHFENDEIIERFGTFDPHNESRREDEIVDFLTSKFRPLISVCPPGGSTRLYSHVPEQKRKHRLGFDVAASGQGNLAVFYIDEAIESQLWLRGLLTCRTEDWHFLKTCLFHFLRKLPRVKAAGDESGLGRQICWEAAKYYSGRFIPVNFASKKHDLGFALMNQLSVGEKRFPQSETDVAADYFALRKVFIGKTWAFTESRNDFNPHSHCDIAWAGALASHAHLESLSGGVSASILLEDGTVIHSDSIPVGPQSSSTDWMIHSDDPRIWKPLFR